MVSSKFSSIDTIFQVCLSNSEYPIIIGRDVLRDHELLRHYLPSKQLFIVTNEKVASYYLEPIKAAFSDRQCNSHLLPDGEAFKNYHHILPVYQNLIKNKHYRDTLLVALGGGVVGDITGFIASTYMRGVPFVQIPTSLIGQVDAAIGGKTGINFLDSKNVIGSFYQPQLVINDLNTLSTLSTREFWSGFGEIIKYALLEGGAFFNEVYRFLKNNNAYNSHDPHDPTFQKALSSIIHKCCQIKIRLIQQDEKEEFNQRILLNLGHTIGHALEAVSNYERWLHGEAVGIGLYCAALLSRVRGDLDLDTLSKVDEMLIMAKLPNRIPHDINLERLIELLTQDKKIKNGKLRFILLKKPGDCFIDESISSKILITTLKSAVYQQ